MKANVIIAVLSLFFSCEKTTVESDMSFVIEELIDDEITTAASSECSDLFSVGDTCYFPFFTGMDLDEETIDKFIINATRYEELVLNNIGHLKNPMWSIDQNGQWVIYYHIENWEGPVLGTAISNMTQEYERIANEWLDLLEAYDAEAPTEVAIKVFGFVFNEGVVLDDSFYELYGNYPIVTNWEKTNEEAPWDVRFKSDLSQFDQNWYEIIDFTTLTVAGNRTDTGPNVSFSPTDWSSYTHPEDVDMFFTKFWHKTTWDAVAQRQYLKLGGNITDYATGETNYTVFAHEMGHCFFHDDIYDSGKYPDNEGLESIMHSHPFITDFDTVIQRMVWEKQK